MLRFQPHLTTFSRSVFTWFKPKREIYSIVKPGKVSPQRFVPDHIIKPPYITQATTPDSNICLKTKDEISEMHEVCQTARKVLNETSRFIEPGITTDELDRILHDLVIRNDAYPSPLLYKGFPKSCCTSVNNVALHGIPDDRPLHDGDVINLDITIYKNGFHGDLSESYAVGHVDENARSLIQITKRALDRAIEISGPGVNLAEIGVAIETVVRASRFTVIPHICGHGIGHVFHEAPDIVHVEYECEHVMVPGMVFTIEPCVSEGGTTIRLLGDGWTYVSADDSRSAQFEQTIAITDDGCTVLTMDDSQ